VAGGWWGEARPISVNLSKASVLERAVPDRAGTRPYHVQFRITRSRAARLLRFSFSSLHFARKGVSRLVDQGAKTLGADAVPAEGDRGLLFHKIGCRDDYRVEIPILCDESFDDVIRGMTGIRIEHLDSTRHRFLADHRPLAIEDQDNIYPRNILVFGQNLDEPVPSQSASLVVQRPQVRPCENHAMAVNYKELRTHAVRIYAVNDERARLLTAELFPPTACKLVAERAGSGMDDSVSSAFSRRRFLHAVAVAVAPVAFLARVRVTLGNEMESVKLDPTPATGDELELTPEETAGPFFQPNSPFKNNFREPGVNGAPIDVTGFVLNRRGKPAPGVLLDFWHADGDGEYDIHGFRCRGHQFSDSDGRYTLETVLPGLYPGRTRHYHVRLQAAHGPVLTTQLYFPGEERNDSDSLFRRELLVKIRETKAGRIAMFNFVLAR